MGTPGRETGAVVPAADLHQLGPASLIILKVRLAEIKLQRQCAAQNGWRECTYIR